VNKIAFTLLLLASTLPATYGQDSEQHLEPVQSIFSIPNYQFEYYSKVRQILAKDLSDYPELSFLTMPSFTEEKLLTIEKKQGSEKFQICYSIAQERIWYSKNRDKVKAKIIKKEIDSVSVNAVKKLYAKAINNARFIHKDLIGFDGTTFYFFVAMNREGRTAKVWSPDKNSTSGRLVKISNQIIELVLDKSKVEFPAKLMKEISDLTNEI
jgi:hypothetical protein